MKLSAEFNALMTILEIAIAEGHSNVLELRERATRDLAMHMSMKLVETEMQRNTRRFQLEEHAEMVAKIVVEMRGRIDDSMTKFKQLVSWGESVELGEQLDEARKAIRKLREVGAEYDFVELGLAEVQAKIQAMV
ncbi:MAG: hypothetical protein E7J78_23310 [Pantoea sp.]|jgi:hypothetical protein|nr:hypothetical protein [Pantoea sp.]